MARSARTAAASLAAIAAGAALAGCVTTQQTNARTLLTNARALARQTPVHVTAEDPRVRVLRVTLIAGRGQDAVVVKLHSSARRPITDLPISVGLTAAKRKQYLNGAANIDYYDTHVPLIVAGGDATWVLPSVRPSEVAHGRLFAVVGAPKTPPSTVVTALPELTVSPSGRGGTGRLSAALENRSGIPQYELAVYATAVRDGRYVGAARQTVGELDGGNRTTVLLPLIGTDARATVALYAPPTIFK